MAWFMHHDIMKAIEVVMGVAQFVIINWKSLYPWQLILVIYPLLCCGEPSKDPYLIFIDQMLEGFGLDNLTNVTMEALMIGGGMPRK
jgi:hypothetical protein